MLVPVLTVKIQSDHGLVTLRDRCRQVGELFGLDGLQRTRLTTAVSEVGRNALQHAGGATVTFLVGDSSTRPGAQGIRVQIVDKGHGLPATVWANGAFQPGAALGGLRGSERLVDAFAITTGPDKGTAVNLEMYLPREARVLRRETVNAGVDELVRRKPQSPREELEQQNREMLHTLEELRQRQSELEQTDLRKNEFVAMLAHELRNPLAAITMTVGLLRLKKTLTPDEVEKYGATIARQTSQLTRLVNDLMDVSSLAQGKVKLERGVMDVDALVSQAIEMTQAFIDAKQHRLILVPAGRPVWVNVDAVRMKQVISNLIHNAVRYTSNGGLIEVTVMAHPDTVSITVKDNGIGIDAAMMPRIFDLFSQASNSFVREDPGLGIGLTIVKKLVREHGGTVLASSPGIGLGSQFTVNIPTVVVPLAGAAPAVVPAAVLARLGVLVIDDNVDAALSIQEMLHLSGHACAVAHDGPQGAAAAGIHQPDVVLIDLGLPLMDGFGVARAIRERHGKGILIIAMSGYSTDGIKDRTEQAGFDDFWVKPIDLQALLSRLPAMLDGKRL